MTEVLLYTRLAPMSHFHTLSKCTGAPQCTCRLHPNPPAWLHPYTHTQTHGAHGKHSPQARKAWSPSICWVYNPHTHIHTHKTCTRDESANAIWWRNKSTSLSNACLTPHGTIFQTYLLCKRVEERQMHTV